MEIFVGLSSFRGNIRRFGFDLLELPVSPTLPRPRTLADYRKERPDVALTFRFAPEVADKGPEHPDVRRVLQACEAAEARAIVIPTGPRFSPTTANKAALAVLANTLRAEGRDVAWEPRGVWAAREAERTAAEIGVVLVRDLTREDAAPGPVVYTRLLPLGLGARVTATGVERLAARLEGAERGYVVIQGEGAKVARLRLREALGLGAGGGARDEDADEDSFDDDDADDAFDDDDADDAFDDDADDDATEGGKQ